MSSVARAVWRARLFTSCATTAKPRPASPARAASIVALRARRLVWPAMSRIRPRIDSIASTWLDSAWLTFTASLAWSPARIATSAATSTSDRASSIARMRPAAVCAASRIATADCSAAAATSLVLPSMPRAEVAVARVRSVSDFDWSVLARTSSADAAFELLALAAALHRRRRWPRAGHLGQDDVGSAKVIARVNASMPASFVFKTARRRSALRTWRMTSRRHVAAGGDEVGHAELARVNMSTAMFGDAAGPSGSIAGFVKCAAIDASATSGAEMLAGDFAAMMSPAWSQSQRDVRSKRAAVGVGRQVGLVTCSSVSRCRCPSLAAHSPALSTSSSSCVDGRHGRDNG